jgi:hypothetical protein
MRLGQNTRHFGQNKDTGISREGLVDSYAVVSKGGLGELPKAKLGKIALGIYDDRFSLTAGNELARKQLGGPAK